MSKKTDKSTSFQTMIGGQALIEGIMMLGPDKKSIVIRKPDGALEEQVQDRVLIKDRYPILGLPFLRGIFNFGSSLSNGVKSLMYSAQFSPEEEQEEPSRLERWLEARLGDEKAASVFLTLAMVLAASFSVGLFLLLPVALAGGIDLFVSECPMWLRNLLEGLLRVAIFMAYLVLCSRMGEMRRLFSYHGAEHKAIFCYEKGLALTVENVRLQPRRHPRCGTSFLFVVIVVAVLISSVVFSFVQASNVWVRMGLHLLMLPVVVSITYEINRFAGGHDNCLTRILTAPGLWMQNWTTFEPDDSMIEVGIRSLQLVIPEKKGADAWNS